MRPHLIITILLGTLSHVLKATDRDVPPKPRQLALSMSGEVSLGSYQAGFLAYGSQTAKLNHFLPPRILTGTSAGSLNALLTVLDVCSAKKPVGVLSYQESVFYKTWVPFGIQELYDQNLVSEYNIFTREHLLNNSVRIKDAWFGGLRKECSLLLGITATRLNQSVTPISRGLYVYRPHEVFVLKITGQGEGIPPTLESLSLRIGGYQSPTLPTSNDPNANYEILEKLVLASSAVPLVFYPGSINLCMDAEQPCIKPEPIMFVDGGMYNNSPVDLSYLIYEQLLGEADHNLQFGLIDSQIRAYPSLDVYQEIESKNGVFENLSLYMINLIRNIKNSGLSRLYEQRHDFTSRLLTSLNHYPLASSPLASFLGFFDVGFREFDFLMGMYDSQKFFKERFQKLKLRFPEEISQNADYKSFACVQKTLDALYIPGECAEVLSPTANLSKLLQISILRLYHTCANFHNMNHINGDEVFCHLRKPVFLHQTFQIKEWEQKPEEYDFEYMLRLLSAYQYEFEDPRLRDEPAKEILSMLAKILESYGTKTQKEEFRLLGLLLDPLRGILDYFAIAKSLIKLTFK